MKTIRIVTVAWEKLRKMAFDDRTTLGAFVARLIEAEWRKRHDEAAV